MNNRSKISKFSEAPLYRWGAPTLRAGRGAGVAGCRCTLPPGAVHRCAPGSAPRGAAGLHGSAAGGHLLRVPTGTVGYPTSASPCAPRVCGFLSRESATTVQLTPLHLLCQRELPALHRRALSCQELLLEYFESPFGKTL